MSGAGGERDLPAIDPVRDARLIRTGFPGAQCIDRFDDDPGPGLRAQDWGLHVRQASGRQALRVDDRRRSLVPVCGRRRAE